ncbi:four-jointed box protein 1 [Pygocentrus nattereri]|uniref:Four-jointed box kinase 1 n=1 Tax=Pygocentrus nattereri TaxID=42514 RepID=A0A3B4BN70_PYGNA|nr:four-jointed box protein 1 [Pygocentrus nattereri]
MRTNSLSFFLALLMRASLCTPSPRASRTESASCSSSSFSTLDSSRVSTVEEAVRVQEQGGTTLRARFPAGFGAAVARRWSEWRERTGKARVVRLEAGCGRTTNRLATLEDGSRACVRYGVDQDQVLGETLCYYLSTMLGIPNVPPLVLTKPDPFSQQWSAVRDSIEALNWSSNAIVSLTQWVSNATRVSIPVQLLRKLGTGVHPAPLTLENMTSSDLRELKQWTDLIVFDYLTANFDRVASHLFNLQWDRRAMDRLTNNLLRTTKGQLVFIDNEAGLVHGYRVLDRWEHLHQTLLNSTCMFRESTVQRLTELTLCRSAAQRLRQVYQTREPLALELGFLSEAQMLTLQNRVDTLYRHFQQCGRVA